MSSKDIDLFESETSFKELANALPQLVWAIDGDVTYVNQKWREYFGQDQVSSDWWEECLHPDDLAESQRKYKLAYETNTAFEIEFRLKRKDGQFRWFLSRGTSIKSKSNRKNTVWFGTCTDIEDSKKTALRETFLSRATSLLASSLNYHTTLANLAGLVVEELADWCTVDMVNETGEPKTLAVLHRDPEKIRYALDLQQKFPQDWNAPTGSPNVLRTGISEIYPEIPRELLALSARSEDELNVLLELNLRSAMVVPLKINKKIIGTISFLSSELGRHYSDYDLMFAEELARRASMAIENAELYQKAETANRAKTDFLANMSHEIRTPLGAILGFTELLADPHQTEEERQRHVLVVRRNGEKLIRLIDEILDLTKVEAAHMELDYSEFSVREMIQDVVTLLMPQAVNKSIGLSFQINGAAVDTDLKVFSDSTRVRQVLLNIIGNAIKFTASGSVSIFVSKSEASNNQSLIHFSIIDTGLGILPGQIPRLFQPFIQADSSMTRRFGGTGLGLALSRKLARALGGDVILEKTHLGVGSTFVFSMETRSIQLVTNKKESLVVDRSTVEIRKNELLNKKILVVDDAEDNRVLVCRYLEQAGAIVQMACDGKDGLEKALKNNFDVVLMDLQMPLLDGFEALEKLKAMSYKRPVIALTAHAMRGDREKCFAAGFSEHLSKPIDRKKLIELIKNI